jgi:DNA invertase Pin-like site-specific DNA recombinase
MSDNRAAIWLRVSGPDQTTENQLGPLQDYAQRRGHEVVQIFDVSNVSAWRGQQEKFLNEVLQQARLGKFNVLLCWALDRLSREGPESILRIVRKFDEAGCQVWSLQEGWTAVGGELRELMLSIAGWVAKMESNRRSERTKAGLARAKASGKLLGRPLGSRDKRKRRRSGYFARYAE